jgi:glycosyltransferase involved in cell wall biosynthesis
MKQNGRGNLADHELDDDGTVCTMHMHRYWHRLQQDPAILGIVACTNEPFLDESLASWADQDCRDYLSWVVTDCSEEESWNKTIKYRADARFLFTFSPCMQGLARVFNLGISSDLGRFLVLCGAEAVLPNNYLSLSRSILEKHPEYGYLTCRISSDSKSTHGWIFFMSRDAATSVGPLSYDFGPGGLSTFAEWLIALRQKGYSPRTVKSLIVPHKRYSIMDKMENWEWIERRNEFRSKYGFDPYLKWSDGFVDDRGDPVPGNPA